jgi:hypothetical protein
MRSKLAILTTVGAMAALVTACGDDHNAPTTPSPPPASTAQSLDTVQVLGLAKETSETASPLGVNDGSLMLTDTSETTEPISVNAT